MDYGDGLLNGVYQFNTKYRKAQMCGQKKPRNWQLAMMSVACRNYTVNVLP